MCLLTDNIGIHWQYFVLFLQPQVLLEENADSRREIRRLKEDNQRLIKQTKQAMVDRDQMLVSTLYRTVC